MGECTSQRGCVNNQESRGAFEPRKPTRNTCSEEDEENEEEQFQTSLQSLRAALQNDYRRCQILTPILPWCRDTCALPRLRTQLFLQDISCLSTPARNNNSAYSNDTQDTDLSIDKLLSIPGAQSPRRVLVLGEPGCGKTTFTFKLAHDWATLLPSDNYLGQFDFVFLLPLRHLQSMTVGQFIEEKLKRIQGDMNDRVCRRILRHLKSSAKLLLILDGFNELRVSSKSSFSVKRIINNADFCQATVIVTSRNDHGIRPENFGRVMQLKSLSWSQVVQFAISFMSEYKVNIERGLQHLYKQAYLVGSLLQCPLYLALFCHLIVTSSEVKVVQTITDLYTEIINFIIRITISSRFKTIKTEESFQLLDNLGHLCLEKVKKGCLLFSQRSLSENEAVLKLGLFTTVHEVTEKLFEATYQPLHSSFVDFLAAFYLWKNRTNQRVFQQHIKDIFQNKGIGGEKLTITFLAGLLGDEEVDCLLRAIPSYYFVGRIGRACKLVSESIIKNPSNLQALAKHLPECGEIFVGKVHNQPLAEALKSCCQFLPVSVSVSMSREVLSVVQPFLKPVEIAAILGSAPDLQDVGLYVTDCDPQVLNFSTALLHQLTTVPPRPQPNFTLAFCNLTNQLELAVKDYITGKQPANLRIYTWKYSSSTESLEKLKVDFLIDSKVFPEKLHSFTFNRLEGGNSCCTSDVIGLLNSLSSCLCLRELCLGGIIWNRRTIGILTKTVLQVHPSSLRLPHSRFSTGALKSGCLNVDTCEDLFCCSAVVKLCDFLVRKSSHLSTLDLSHCQLTQEDVNLLEKAVINNRTLRVLNLTLCLSPDGNPLTFNLNTLNERPHQWEQVTLTGWRLILPACPPGRHSSWPKVEMEVLHLNDCIFEGRDDTSSDAYDYESSAIAMLVFQWDIITIACDVCAFLKHPTNLWQSCRNLTSLHLRMSREDDSFFFGNSKRHFHVLSQLSLQSLFVDIDSSHLNDFHLESWSTYLRESSLQKLCISLVNEPGNKNCQKQIAEDSLFLPILHAVIDNKTQHLQDLEICFNKTRLSLWHAGFLKWTNQVVDMIQNSRMMSLLLYLRSFSSTSLDAFLENIQKTVSDSDNTVHFAFKYIIEDNMYRMKINAKVR